MTHYMTEQNIAEAQTAMKSFCDAFIRIKNAGSSDIKVVMNYIASRDMYLNVESRSAHAEIVLRPAAESLLDAIAALPLIDRLGMAMTTITESNEVEFFWASIITFTDSPARRTSSRHLLHGFTKLPVKMPSRT